MTLSGWEWYEEGQAMLEHLKNIESNKRMLWAYINLQEYGSRGWIMTRKYRIPEIHKEERIKTIFHQAYRIYMMNRAILLKSLS